MEFGFRKKRRIHLDYAATTPVHPEVFAAMRPYFSDTWANPSAIYEEGVAARRSIENARTELARLFHIRPEGVIFTSGGTESNNFAIIGVVEETKRSGVSYEDMEILSTKIEHPSILETLKYLQERGVRITYIPVNEEGIIDTQILSSRLSANTILVTFAYVNSEVGTVQDVKGITRVVKKWNIDQGKNVLVHLDASQAPLWLPCELDRLGVHLMTLDAGKCYGPKGSGVLLRVHGVNLSPILFGGGQEGGMRPGTENAALIIGCSKALIRAQGKWETQSASVALLRDTLISHIAERIPEAVMNGSRDSRVANNVNVYIPGIDSEYAVIWLDERGITASTRSACGVGDKNGSHVIREITGDEKRARSSIRFTLGEETKERDVIVAVEELAEHLKLVR